MSLLMAVRREAPIKRKAVQGTDELSKLEYVLPVLLTALLCSLFCWYWRGKICSSLKALEVEFVKDVGGKVLFVLYQTPTSQGSANDPHLFNPYR